MVGSETEVSLNGDPNFRLILRLKNICCCWNSEFNPVDTGEETKDTFLPFSREEECWLPCSLFVKKPEEDTCLPDMKSQSPFDQLLKLRLNAISLSRFGRQ